MSTSVKHLQGFIEKLSPCELVNIFIIVWYRQFTHVLTNLFDEEDILYLTLSWVPFFSCQYHKVVPPVKVYEC